MTRILLIRHAQAASPDDLRLPGPDLPLLPVGEDQCRKLAQRVRSFGPKTVYASDARRAHQTGEIVAGICGIPLRVDPALREIDFGGWAGQTYADITAADSAAAAWFSNPETRAPPGGERIADAAGRTLAALRALAAEPHECVAVIGHAGSLRLAVAMALGIPLASYWRLQLDCAGLSVLVWTADGPLLERWNDTTDLERDADPSTVVSAIGEPDAAASVRADTGERAT